MFKPLLHKITIW